MKQSSIYHTPVLLQETLRYLNPIPGEIYVDCTLGGGGHSEAILENSKPNGKLIGIDQDSDAIEAAQMKLGKYGDRVIIVNNNFNSLKNILQNLNIEKVNGILIDLGVSTHQLETPERGFSFNPCGLDAKLDMRMNQNQQLKAYDIVNFYPEKELKRIFFELGEEPFANKIAAGIIKARETKLIETTSELVEIIKRSTPPDYRYSPRSGHWASKIFRAIRMEVNQELPVLQDILPQTLECLKKNGRLVIISFHSLEDRIVKQQFVSWQKAGMVEILTPRPIETSPEEAIENPKSESAKLRAVKIL
jgi:16S rRNA (cytosine1402-N4)-methyltransferase